MSHAPEICIASSSSAKAETGSTTGDFSKFRVSFRSKERLRAAARGAQPISRCGVDRPNGAVVANQARLPSALPRGLRTSHNLQTRNSPTVLSWPGNCWETASLISPWRFGCVHLDSKRTCHSVNNRTGVPTVLHNDLTKEGRAALWVGELEVPHNNGSGAARHSVNFSSRPSLRSGYRAAPPSFLWWLCRPERGGGRGADWAPGDLQQSDTQQTTTEG
jgi:hypothetical protein